MNLHALRKISRSFNKIVEDALIKDRICPKCYSNLDSKGEFYPDAIIINMHCKECGFKTSEKIFN